MGRASADRFEELQEAVWADYEVLTPNSRRVFDQARITLPGGVSGNLRFFSPYPIYMRSAEGCRTWDVDGHEYIDYFLGNGPLLLGHRHPAVEAAAVDAATRSALLYNPEAIVAASRLMRDLVPCAEQVRFLNSGTEAVMTAVRLARAFTGKSVVVKFFGHYHGQDDQFLIGRDRSRQPFSAGVPEEAVSNTILLDYGRIDLVVELLESNDDIACVLLDPQMHAGGIWPADRAYLRALARLTREHEVVLIFDEVISGFRLAPGGAQEFFGVVPDLATFAKALAAGARLAAVAGRTEIMQLLDPLGGADAFAVKDRGVYQSGTGNDGSAGLASAIAALATYRDLGPKGYQRLRDLGALLKAGIIKEATDHGIPCHVNQLGPSLKVFLTDEAPSFETFLSVDKGWTSLFLHALINEGVFTVPPSGAFFISFAHTEEDVRRTTAAVGRALDRYPFHGLWSANAASAVGAAKEAGA